MPTELIEAAKVDGATESQVFWRITLPQIAPTIGVVVTALFVTVMKVFDIVYAMTNGNFGTQVIANEMWIQRRSAQSNLGLGSALAVVLFVSVIPVMWINLRRMQRERAGVKMSDGVVNPDQTHPGAAGDALSLRPLDPDVGAVAARAASGASRPSACSINSFRTA